MNIKNMRVAVLEDDPLISFHLQIQLSLLKVEKVFFFESRSQGLHYLNREKVDLIITNLRLIDGWLSFHELTEIASFCTPILILTGFRDDLMQCHPILSTKTSLTYLFKPYNFYQLKKSLFSL